MSDLELGTTVLGSVSGLSLIVSAILTVLVCGQIAKRAGFSRWLSLFLLVPIIGEILPIVFAFIPWPVESKVRKSPVRKRKRTR